MQKKVELGQHYQTMGKAALRWQVVKIVDQGGIPHARLLAADGSRDTRLVACSVLADTSRYRFLKDGALGE